MDLPNFNEFTSTPEETIHSNWSDGGFEFFHVSFIIPWLDIHDNVGLGNDFTLLGFFFFLLLVVGCDTFGLDSFGFSIFFVIIRTEEIDIIIGFFSSWGSGFNWGYKLCWTALNWVLVDSLKLPVCRSTRVRRTVFTDILIRSHCLWWGSFLPWDCWKVIGIWCNVSMPSGQID